MPPSALGTGIVDVVTALATDRAAAWSEAFDQSSSETIPTRPVRSSSAAIDGLTRAVDHAGGTELGFDAVLRDLTQTLHELNEGLDQATQLIADRVAASHAGSAEDGAVRVAVNGSGALTTVVFDEDWLARATGREITRALESAIEEAAVAVAASAADPLAGTPLERYARAASDPQALAALILGTERS